MTDHISAAVSAALDGMGAFGPEPFLQEVNRKLSKVGETLTESELVEAITSNGRPESTSFHVQLLRWDAEPDAAWIGGTEPHTLERRKLVLEALDLAPDSRVAVDDRFPPAPERSVLIAEPSWDPWYTEARRREHDFYWTAYRGVLRRAGWGGDAIAELDRTTSQVVGRLADPTSSVPYQARGLVVGHVQSGKTANFTGVLAKAIDAGYRLIIVLTGTVEMLRGQTQRRLDKELIGVENILQGADPGDPEAVKDIDYISTGDQDWLDDAFLRHGVDIVSLDEVPGIRRLTGLSFDYKNLKAGLTALDYKQELKVKSKPLWDAENLFPADVRIAIVKKNKTVLQKLVADLKLIHSKLDEIPTLIIDDEADQASVNTTSPTKVDDEGRKERTAINRLISQLVTELKRSQYVGYTATPFANVFISPDDSEDIFPKDFILSLAPSPEYMGGERFHDLDGVPFGAEDDPALSNARAYVRDLDSQDPAEERAELREAIDAFVLSGAIKIWREARGEGVFKHHTMLVHESVRIVEHNELAGVIVDVWNTGGYSSPEGKSRLRGLFETDFVPVWRARRHEWGTSMPETFDELAPYLGAAIDRITMKRSPVVVVNGAAEKDYEQLDFNSERVWRILVGGAKLSRGFTVEGLTISYYRRRTMAADSLMQMGRWFGYRKGYGDLVRLYIARNAVGPRGKTVDLYEAFEAILRDERDFRAQLGKFAKLKENGEPVVRPIDVPPLVFQQLPWLTPTSRNKMYNAELVHEGDGGVVKDFPRQPDRAEGANAGHFDIVRPWVERLGALKTFEYRERTSGVVDELTEENSTVRTFEARVAIVDARDLRDALAGFRWTQNFNFEPHLAFMDLAIAEGTLVDWAVVLPELKGAEFRSVGGVRVPLINRKRRADREGFSGSSFRQRHALQHIASNPAAMYGGPEAESLRTETRGAMLLSFALDPLIPSEASDAEAKRLRDPKNIAPDADIAPDDVATLFSLVLPYWSAPSGRVGFRVRDESRGAIIDR